jgi:hypothetical protein
MILKISATQWINLDNVTEINSYESDGETYVHIFRVDKVRPTQYKGKVAEDLLAWLDVYAHSVDEIDDSDVETVFCTICYTPLPESMAHYVDDQLYCDHCYGIA